MSLSFESSSCFIINNFMSREEDLNPQPTVYDTVALPVELSRPVLQAGERNRTAINSLGRNRNNHYTTPAYSKRPLISPIKLFQISSLFSMVSSLISPSSFIITTIVSPGFLYPNSSLILCSQ